MVPEKEGAQEKLVQEMVNAPMQRHRGSALNQSRTLWTDCPEAHPSPLNSEEV